MESRARRKAAAARCEAAKAEMVELDVAERRGEMTGVAEVDARYALVRTRLLGAPLRAAQRLPHLTGEMASAIDDLIRQALEELANGDGDGDVRPGARSWWCCPWWRARRLRAGTASSVKWA
jgi:phage terminase Nu1 subunit (DNA packaging protein)